MTIGATLCATVKGCVIGAPLIFFSADVGGSGIPQMVYGDPEPTLVGHIGGPKAQAIEENFVNATMLAYPGAQGYAMWKTGQPMSFQKPTPTPTEAASPADPAFRIMQGSSDDIARASTSAMVNRTGYQRVDLRPGSLSGVTDLTIVAHGIEHPLLPRSGAAASLRIGSSPTSPTVLARALEEAGWKGGTLRLVACGAGKCVPGTNTSYGQVTADALTETAVIAPKGNVNILNGVRGLPQVRSDSGWLGFGRLYRPGRGWEIFTGNSSSPAKLPRKPE